MVHRIYTSLCFGNAVWQWNVVTLWIKYKGFLYGTRNETFIDLIVWQHSFLRQTGNIFRLLKARSVVEKHHNGLKTQWCDVRQFLQKCQITSEEFINLASGIPLLVFLFFDILCVTTPPHSLIINYLLRNLGNANCHSILTHLCHTRSPADNWFFHPRPNETGEN